MVQVSLVNTYLECREAISVSDETGSQIFDTLLIDLVSFYRFCKEKAPYLYDAADLSSSLHLLKRNDVLLHTPRCIDKLRACLTGRALSDDQRICSEKELERIIIDLAASTAIFEMVYEEDELALKQAGQRFASKYKVDSPPFPESIPIDEQVFFKRRVRSTFRRQFDPSFGYWSQTYLFQRPQGEQCGFDDFALGVAKEVSVITTRNHDRFPGNGRMLTGFEIDRIFPPDRREQGDGFDAWRNETLKAYGPILNCEDEENFHALDHFKNARIIPLRGQHFITCSSSFFEIEGEHMSFVNFSDTFDGAGVKMAMLVPTSVVDSFFEDCTIEHDGYKAGDFAKKDITEFPPTVANMRTRCLELRTKVGLLDLSTGSIYEGGHCNAPEPCSHPYHEWEIEHTDVQDDFGHAHKFFGHLQLEEAGAMTVSTHFLKQLRWIDSRIAEIAHGYMNVFDIYRIAQGLDARGMTVRRLEKGPLSYEIDEEVGLAQSADDLSEVEESDVLSSAMYEQQLSGSRRMLELVCRFNHDKREGSLPVDRAPVLVFTPILAWSRVSSTTPWILDAATGYVYSSDGDPFEFIPNKDGSPSKEMVSWWEQKVYPYLEKEQWSAPRLVDRQMCSDLIEKYIKRTKV